MNSLCVPVKEPTWKHVLLHEHAMSAGSQIRFLSTNITVLCGFLLDHKCFFSHQWGDICKKLDKITNPMVLMIQCKLSSICTVIRTLSVISSLEEQACYCNRYSGLAL